jgi:peptidoglycan/LPS O-acetylase OafA/YrhL
MDKNFFEELWDRFKMPWKHIAFKSYFFWIVIVFGGLGIIITCCEELGKETPIFFNIARSVATTFIALIAASLVDLNLSFNIKNIPSLIINSLALIGVSILLLYFSFTIQTELSLLPAIIGYVLSILIWILANADNERLSDGTYYKKMLERAAELSKDWK